MHWLRCDSTDLLRLQVAARRAALRPRDVAALVVAWARARRRGAVAAWTRGLAGASTDAQLLWAAATVRAAAPPAPATGPTRGVAASKCCTCKVAGGTCACPCENRAKYRYAGLL